MHRQPDNAIGWLLCWASFLLAVADAGGVYVSGGHPGAARGHHGGVGCDVCLDRRHGLLGRYLALLFPDGHLASRRWRPVLGVGTVALGVGLVGVGFGEGPIDAGYPENPLGLPGADSLQAALLVIPLMVVSGAVSQIVRFRRGTAVERQQLKWVVTTFALVGALIGDGRPVGARRRRAARRHEGG